MSFLCDIVSNTSFKLIFQFSFNGDDPLAWIDLQLLDVPKFLDFLVEIRFSARFDGPLFDGGEGPF